MRGLGVAGMGAVEEAKFQANGLRRRNQEGGRIMIMDTSFLDHVGVALTRYGQWILRHSPPKIVAVARAAT